MTPFMEGFVGSLLGILLAAGIIVLSWRLNGRKHKGNPVYLDGKKYHSDY